MHVVECEHERALLRQRNERGGEGGVQAAAERLGLQPSDLLGHARQAEQAGEERDRRRGACTLKRLGKTAL